MKPRTRTIAHEASWILSNDTVDAAITQRGGHLAPVQFFHDSEAPVQPYWINPWHGEQVRLDKAAACLKPLRGDFFCMPFGANADPVGDEEHPVHGEAAARTWSFVDADGDGEVSRLRLKMHTRVRKGKVVKDTLLRAGQSAVYQQHTLSGYDGAMPVGHHHTLALPEDHPASVLVASSPIALGMTNPGVFSDPAEGEYQSLAMGETFTSLSRVPTLWKKPATTDCSAFPTRRGFADLLQILQKPTGKTPAWITATYTSEGYLWYALKDTATLPATVMWMENHGRWSHPWHGRSCCLGLENTCSYFADGLARATRANKLKRAGFETALKLDPDAPTVIRVIQGVVRTPKKFRRVDRVAFERNKATFISGKRRAVARINWEFLQSGDLQAVN